MRHSLRWAVLDRRGVRTKGEPSAAVAELFHEHYSPLVGLAVVLTGDRELAEDVVQDAFASLLRSWKRLRDPNAAPSYLRTTVVNLARSALRRRLLRMRRSVALATSTDDAPEPVERIAMLRALRALPYRQRVCVALRYYECLSPEEVASVMGTSVGTVKSQTHKALRRLEQLLEE